MQRHLGLVLTSDLRWTAHVNQVLSKAARLLHTLKRLRCTLSKAALTLYHCLYIRPVVEYGCVAWPKLPAYLRDRLERFQRRAFKVILRKPLFEHCAHDAMGRMQKSGLPSNRVAAGQVDPPAVRITMVCSLCACCLSASEAFLFLSGAVCWVFSNAYTKEEHLLVFSWLVIGEGPELLDAEGRSSIAPLRRGTCRRSKSLSLQA